MLIKDFSKYQNKFSLFDGLLSGSIKGSLIVSDKYSYLPRARTHNHGDH